MQAVEVPELATDRQLLSIIPCPVQVVSVTNSELATYVAGGVTYDKLGADITYTVPAMRIITSFAQVQQGQLSNAVEALASKLANITQSALTTEIAQLESVSNLSQCTDIFNRVCLSTALQFLTSLLAGLQQ